MAREGAPFLVPEVGLDGEGRDRLTLFNQLVQENAGAVYGLLRGVAAGEIKLDLTAPPQPDNPASPFDIRAQLAVTRLLAEEDDLRTDVDAETLRKVEEASAAAARAEEEMLEPLSRAQRSLARRVLRLSVYTAEVATHKSRTADLPHGQQPAPNGFPTAA